MDWTLWLDLSDEKTFETDAVFDITSNIASRRHRPQLRPASDERFFDSWRSAPTNRVSRTGLIDI